MIVGLIAMAYLLSFLGLKYNTSSFRTAAVFVAPVCLLLVTAIEVMGFYLVHSDIFWWCSYDTYGFFGSLLRLIPFTIVVLAQIYSFFIYTELYFYDDYDASECRSFIYPAGIAMLSCIPLAVVVGLILDWCGVSDHTAETIAFVVGCVILLAGIAVTFWQGICDFGAAKALPISLVAMIYIIGCMVALIGIIVLVIRLIIQVIIVCVGIFIALALLGGGGGGNTIYRDSSGHRYRRID